MRSYSLRRHGLVLCTELSNWFGFLPQSFILLLRAFDFSDLYTLLCYLASGFLKQLSMNPELLELYKSSRRKNSEKLSSSTALKEKF